MTFKRLLSILWRRWRCGLSPDARVITRWNDNPWRWAFMRRRKFDEYENEKRIREAGND
jgi:hypothetical protein